MGMRTLVLGAGATGGYFGARLLEAGRDVTFLVRAGRAARLAESGLIVRSPYGDVTLSNPPTVTADQLGSDFDLVILSCKAYDLDEAIESIRPALRSDTMILPLLNGMRHLDVLDREFGGERVLGGLCAIAATLDDQGTIVHMNDLHTLVFGLRGGATNGRLKRIADTLADAGFKAVQSDDIEQDMWEKWVILATLASATCLMRAPVGRIVTSPGGEKLMLGLLEECREIAESAGYAPRAAFLQRARTMLTASESDLTASMLRDLESGSRIEADHIVGDLLRRRALSADADRSPSLLEIAYAHLNAYAMGRDG